MADLPRIIRFGFDKYKIDDKNGAVSEQQSTSTQADSNPPPAKRSKLFSSYMQSASTPSSSSITAQLDNYLEIPYVCDEDDSDIISFWQSSKIAKDFDKLLYSAMRALSVPASSSPVERVFSQGGLILRPHRARMSDSRLSSLIFLKCNSKIMWLAG